MDLSTGSKTWKVPKGTITGKSFVGGPLTLPEFFDRLFGPKDIAKDEVLFFEGTNLTKEEFFEKVSCLSTALLKEDLFKLIPGETVAICSRNFPEWCISYLAVTSVGCVAVSLPNNLNRKQLDAAVRASKSRLLICDEASYKTVMQVHMKLASTVGLQLVLIRPSKKTMLLLGKIPGPRRLGKGAKAGYDLEAVVEEGNANDFEPAKVEEDSEAAIFMSEDAKTNPIFSHRAILNAIKSMLVAYRKEKLPDNPVVLSTARLFKVAGITELFLLTVARGGKLVLKDDWTSIGAHITRNKVTEVYCTKEELEKLLTEGKDTMAMLKAIHMMTEDISSGDLEKMKEDCVSAGLKAPIYLYKRSPFSPEPLFMVEISGVLKTKAYVLETTETCEYALVDGKVHVCSTSQPTGFSGNMKSMPFITVNKKAGYLKTDMDGAIGESGEVLVKLV